MKSLERPRSLQAQDEEHDLELLRRLNHARCKELRALLGGLERSRLELVDRELRALLETLDGSKL